MFLYVCTTVCSCICVRLKLLRSDDKVRRIMSNYKFKFSINSEEKERKEGKIRKTERNLARRNEKR